MTNSFYRTVSAFLLLISVSGQLQIYRYTCFVSLYLSAQLSHTDGQTLYGLSCCREAGKVGKLTTYHNAGEYGNNPGDDSPFLVQQDIQFFFLQRTLVT